MTDSNELDELADDLWRARLDGTTIPAERAGLIATIDDAYAVQERQMTADGLTIAGWKLGATAQAGLDAMGLAEPFVARLLERFVMNSGETVALIPAHLPKAETEFSITIGTDLPPREKPYTRTEVLEATGGISGGFEIVSSRFGPMIPKAGLRTIADGGLNGTIIVSKAAEGWRDADPVRQPVTVRRNGEVAAADCTTDGTLWPDPIQATTWLANNPRIHPRGLRAGDIIMTGTFAPLIDVADGDTLSADFGPFGSVEARFEAAGGRPERPRSAESIRERRR